MDHDRQIIWALPSAHLWLASMPGLENRPRGKARWPERIETPPRPAKRRKARLRWVATSASHAFAAAAHIAAGWIRQIRERAWAATVDIETRAS